MSYNEGFFTFSAEPTENLGLDQLEDADNDDESPLADGGDQTLSSSSDDEAEDASDEEMEESDDQNSDAEEGSENEDDDDDSDDVYLTANVYGTSITVPAASVTEFAKEMEVDQFPIQVLISNEEKEVSTYIDMNNKYRRTKRSFGTGFIGHAALVRKSFGLPEGCSLRMKYDGYSMRSPSNSNYKREKVYKLQIVNIGAFKESEPEAPDWAAEAATQPLVPPQLPHGVPTHLSMNVPSGSSLWLSVEQYKIFMDQIGQPYKGRVDALAELESEGCARYYTSFRGTGNVGFSFFRKGKMFCNMSGFGVGDGIRMHYLGYRELSDGRKVYCLRVEKISSARKARSANKVRSDVKNEEPLEPPPRLAKKRAQDALAKHFSSGGAQGAPSPMRQQGPSLNKQATKVPAQKIPQPRNTARNIKPSQLTTASPAPTSTAPATAVRPQQGQQQRQQMRQQPNNDAGPSNPRQQYVPAPLRQQDPEKQQPGSSIVGLVVKALLHRTDIDRTLVGKYLSLFARLPEITRDIDGSVILRLAAEPSVEALQTFLQSAV